MNKFLEFLPHYWMNYWINKVKKVNIAHPYHQWSIIPFLPSCECGRSPWADVAEANVGLLAGGWLAWVWEWGLGWWERLQWWGGGGIQLNGWGHGKTNQAFSTAFLSQVIISYIRCQSCWKPTGPLEFSTYFYTYMRRSPWALAMPIVTSPPL